MNTASHYLSYVAANAQSFITVSIAAMTADRLRYLITTAQSACSMSEPRRAKQRHNLPWTEIALGGWFAITSFIGAFIGTILAQLT